MKEEDLHIQKQQVRANTRKNINIAISKGYQPKYTTWDTDEKLLEEISLAVKFMIEGI